MEKKKKMSSTGEFSFEDLPREILCEIFSRLPIKCLMQCKCLSRFHNSLIGLDRDSNLVDLHHDHQRRTSTCNSLSTKFLLRTISKRRSDHQNFYRYYTIGDHDNNKKPSILKLDGVSTYSRFAYAKGLFCLWSENFDPVFIFNPTCRESRFLPRLNINEDFNYRCHYSLGFDTDLKKHKILMKLVDPKMQSMRHCWIFTLGETTWREINCNSVTNFYPMIKYDGVYIDGSVYFHCGQPNIWGLKIMSFNFTTEDFRIISLWDGPSGVGMRIGYFFNLVQLEGKLAAIDSRFSRLTIWILQSPETGEWVRGQGIDVPREGLVAEKSYEVTYHRCTCTTDKKEEIAVMKINPNGILVYNLKEDEWRSIRILGRPEKSKIIGIYSYEYCIYSLGQT